MKIAPDDPVLTAYALGELEESKASEVAAALAADDGLACEYASITSLAGLLTDTLRGGDLSLGEERRAEILKSGQRPDADVLVLEHRKRSRRQSMMVVAGVAAVVVAGFVGLSKLGTSHSVAPGGGGEAANSGGSGGVAVPEKAGGGENSVGVNPAIGSVNSIPIHIKSVDPTFVEKSLNKNGTLPGADRFKVQSWVNACQVSSAPKVTVGGVGVYSELGPCPWDPEASLLLINLRPPEGRKVSLEATLNFNPARVVSASLLGAKEGEQTGISQAGVLEAAKTFLYQVELKSGDGQVGSIDLKGADDSEGYLPIGSEPKEAGFVSTDFTVARTLAEFAMWGASAGRDPDKLESLASVARGLLSTVTDEQTRYALDMILLSEESLKR